jgi:crotonobetainyl-CoA:carnitine CoA-transferase CaiB-like acyl-CoA transferase/enoyl-CoA hydratase/carnithine racemase
VTGDDVGPPTTDASGSPEPAAQARALTGVRILDLSQVMSGPYCTMILADLGADVIKIENPMHGDQTRKSWGYSVVGEDSRAFLSLNRNKRSVALDLKTDEGRATFLGLARTADVVIENFRPGVAARLGVGYEDVRAVRPDIVYASISGFGQTGPYSGYPGYDLIAQAMTGIMSVTGEPGGVPVKSDIPIADLGAGLFAAIGILAALHSRAESGEGQYLETSLFEAALALSVWQSTEFWSTGVSPVPLGSANRMSAPYQALATQDGYVTVGANNEKLWRLLCDTLDAPELLDDPRFVDNNRRMDNRLALVVELERRLSRRTTDEWVASLLAHGVPAGPIRTYEEVLLQDPHVKARQMVAAFDHPVEGRTSVLASPLRMYGTPVKITSPPPLLGQHTTEVLSALEPVSPAAGAPSTEASVTGETAEGVLRIRISNPGRRNAFTWEMYDQLQSLLDGVRHDPDVRVVTLEGSAEDGFAAGTDIRQFVDFRTGRDGVAYERRVGEVVRSLLSVPVPVVALVQGAAVGAGLVLAACCDVVVAEAGSRFGVPVVRTLGNAVPAAVVARLRSRVGAAYTDAMLLTATLFTAEELAATGFVARVAPVGTLQEEAARLVGRVRDAAPVSVAALKELHRRVEAGVPTPLDDDVLDRAYGSDDFHEGVAAFLDGRRPDWKGR